MHTHHHIILPSTPHTPPALLLTLQVQPDPEAKKDVADSISLVEVGVWG